MTGIRHEATPSRRLIYLTFFLTGIVNTLLGPLLPWMTERWNLSDATAGALFTAMFAGGLTGGLASGWIAARAGDGRTMGGGMLLMAAGVAAMGTGAFHTAWSGILAAGVGLGLVIPPMNLLVVRISPERAAAASAALNLAWGVGAMTWPIALAAMQPVVGVPATLVVLGVIVALTGGRLGRVRPSVAAVSRGAEAQFARATATVLLFGILIVLYTGVETTIGGWVTEYGRRMSDRASPLWELPAAAFWGGLTGGRAGVAWRLADRHAARALFGGLMMAAVCVPLLLASRDPLVFCASAALAGLGLAPVFPITVAALARSCEPRIAGALIALASLGGAIMPWFAGVISDRAGSLTAGLATQFGFLLLLIAGHALRLRGSPPHRQT